MTIEECEADVLTWLGELRVGEGYHWRRHVAVAYEGSRFVKIGDAAIPYDPPATSARVVVRLWTRNFMYQLLATPTYLGCTSQERAPRPGEDWSRGSDVADGDFSRETWGRIAFRILGRELDLMPVMKESA